MSLLLMIQVAAAVAAKIVNSMSKMGDVLSTSIKVGGPPVRISVPAMAMDIRKSAAESLLEDKIESNIGSCDIESIGVPDDDNCLSVQVK